MTRSNRARRPVTIQQLRALRLRSEGKGTREIAEAMGISPSTVKSHLWRAYKALGAADGASAVRICYERGLFPLEPPHSTNTSRQGTDPWAWERRSTRF